MSVNVSIFDKLNVSKPKLQKSESAILFIFILDIFCSNFSIEISKMTMLWPFQYVVTVLGLVKYCTGVRWAVEYTVRGVSYDNVSCWRLYCILCLLFLSLMCILTLFYVPPFYEWRRGIMHGTSARPYDRASVETQPSFTNGINLMKLNDLPRQVIAR